MVIWLASYPRSGNTYFRLLLNQLHGIKTRSIYNDPLLAELEGSAEIVGHEDWGGSLQDLENSGEIFLVKTHHLPSDTRPAIHLVRDGRDALVSYSQYICSFENPYLSMGKVRHALRSMFGWSESHAILRRLIESKGGDFGCWSESVVAWGSRKSRTVSIRYEDLVADPIGVVARALEELCITGNRIDQCSRVTSFAELNERWPQFFRQGKAGNWKTLMTPSLEALFWKHHGDGMRMFGYR